MWKLFVISCLISCMMFCLAAAQEPTPPPATQPPPNPRLEGRVLSQAGAELSKATLRLWGTTHNYAGDSDSAGNFVFESVDPGDYTLTVDRTGYVRSLYNTSHANQRGVFTLKAGQVKADVIVKLIPQAVIAGKVTDRDGDPMDRARVTAYRKVYTAGVWRLQYVQASTAALDGAYQIGGLAAGKYYLAAEDSDTATGLPPGEAGRPGIEERYVATYHPSALDAAAAVAVGVAAGEEVGHVDIRIRKERVYRVRGRAISMLTSAPLTRIALGIAPIQTDPSGIRTDPKLKLGMTADGGFEFGQLLPGSYILSTQGGLMLNGQLYSDVPLVARRAIQISDKNVEDLVLQLGPPAEISGTFRLEDSDQAPAVMSVGLVALDGLSRGNTPIVRSNPDGTFTIPAVAPNLYRVSVSGLANGTYVKSLHLEGLDVTRTPLDLTSGAGGKLEILISPEAADITGTVRNENGNAVAGVTLTLWEPGLPPGAPDTTKTAVADQSGAFRFQNLPPGDYRVAAVAEIDPEMAAIPASAVRLNARDHASVDVKLR